MNSSASLIPIERIERSILFIRGQKIMLDADLAEIYGVETKRLNEQVRRNSARFPSDFMFQLTEIEKNEVVANCDHLSRIRFSPHLPFAFTEHGALTSVQVIRAFVRLRALFASNVELARKLSTLEKKYDAQFKIVFDAIRQLMTPPETKRREIGFHVKYDDEKSGGKAKLKKNSAAKKPS